MNMRIAVFWGIITLTSWAVPDYAQVSPTFEQVIALRNVGNPVLSPNGKDVVFSVTTTNWEGNCYDTELWISRDGKTPFQLTQTHKGSSQQAAWSPDGQWIAFLAERSQKQQIHVLRVDGGEAFAATDDDEGIAAFEWHPDGKSFIFKKYEKNETLEKEREKRYGAFEKDDESMKKAHLWRIDFKPDGPSPREMPCYEKTDSLRVKAHCIEKTAATRLTDGAFTVTGFRISPDGKKVAYSHQPNVLSNSFMKSDVSLLDLASGKSSPLVTNRGGDFLEDWSPDSQEVLVSTDLDDSVSNYYRNNKLIAVHIEDKRVRYLAEDFDERIGQLSWNPAGIFFTAWNKTRRPLYRIDPQTGKVKTLTQTPDQIFGLSFSRAGDRVAVSARADNELNEIFVTTPGGSKPTKVTDMTSQVSTWKTAQSEVISWKSRDGIVIEGVLHKPQDYQPGRKYPLMVIIHGGPTGIDTPMPVPGYVYPILQWLNKGALILRPNYRGSSGYGEKFRSLNVENLGIGDAWDVVTGIEHLNDLGIIDTTRMGCMGWSQGGYISAFLATSTNVFKAVSVGAGISNWRTYYASTDIHPFTLQYLKATPWDNDEIYRKTSPISYINQATTPTLIQHGEFDTRVPIANAYELLQGLRDKGVATELIVYKGFGHGISKPRERLAAVWHNWQWFNKYIWREETPIPLLDQ